MRSMAINLYNIKKWYKMLIGKSVSHVKQDVGRFYKKDYVAGYYNDMTEKVIKQPGLLISSDVPHIISEKGEDIIFPVAVFQYGLGAYDLWIEKKEPIYLEKFRQCVAWSIDNQQQNGAWNNFFFYYPDHPYGAMAQGEGASLLIRAYIEFNDNKYLEAARNAIDFMLLPIEAGGTTDYKNNDLVMLEYTHRECVLNGWVFSLFGLYDYAIASDDERYREVWEKATHSLEKRLPDFYGKYWSMYDLAGRISSPFYHHLHIAQMKAMYDLTGYKLFKDTSDRWEKYDRNKLFKALAFIKKMTQKLFEKESAK